MREGDQEGREVHVEMEIFAVLLGTLTMLAAFVLGALVLAAVALLLAPFWVFGWVSRGLKAAWI